MTLHSQTSLQDFGIKNTLRPKYKSERQIYIETEGFNMKELKSADVVKFEKEGDSVEGEYRGFEESKQYKDSFAIHIKDGDKTQVVFTNNIVPDLIRQNNIELGAKIKIEYTGLKKNSSNTFQHKTYKVYAE